MLTTLDNEADLLTHLHSSKCVEGFTHNFYRYPARMLPDLAREIINQFSLPGDFVFDPFMGGGTSIVEALAAGRQAIGVDINSLAVFIAKVKTTPLSPRDETLILGWTQSLDFSNIQFGESFTNSDSRTKNIPVHILKCFDYLLNEVSRLPYIRQQQFARCCILRLGQWVLDGREIKLDEKLLKDKIFHLTEEMLADLNEFVKAVQSNGIAKNKLKKQSMLLLRSAKGIHEDERLLKIISQPTLVITSPPYPGIHMLYHRWQVNGRRETPAPYWLIGAKDGQFASYYTLGGRSQKGIDNYFSELTEIYRSVRAVINSKAHVVQLVSFSDINRHLPRFLEAMELAGFEEFFPISVDRNRLWRAVPNRKWYNRIDPSRYPSQELLLFHRPIISS